jgi:hypothetical protein
MILYVSVNGCDKNVGTKQEPFFTIEKARNTAREYKKNHNEGIIVRIGRGTHYIERTLTFSPEDSGENGTPVIYEGEDGAVISGGCRLYPQWEHYQNGIYKTSVPANIEFDQLFVNGSRQILARYPNFDPQSRYFNGYASDVLSQERVKGWCDPTGGFFHAMHGGLWGDFHYKITGKNDQNEVTYIGGWQNNRASHMNEDIRFVENIFEELDSCGEWFLDRKVHILYYIPPDDCCLDTAIVECALLKTIFRFEGTNENPLHHITLKNLAFSHTMMTFMEPMEPLLRSDWMIYRGGALFLQGTEDILMDQLYLRDVGGNGIFVSAYNRRVQITNSRIENAGASSVCFVGNHKAVRSPLFEFSQERDSSEMLDETPGPQSEDYPFDCLLYDCLLTHNGRFEKQTAGVEISMASRITVSHNSIYDVPRAGINIGDGTWGGHIIEYNDVFNTVLETSDHGAFNSWGRDRYWHPDIRRTDNFVQQHPASPFWDVVEPNILRFNRFQCAYGWDIDLDDGSSNYRIYGNLLLQGGLKFREGYDRHAYNNIMVNNTFHPHVWYENSRDIFRNNLVFTPYQPIAIEFWGNQIDYNFLYVGGNIEIATQLQSQSGMDEHSLQGDAQFYIYSNGEYSLEASSPLWEMGFELTPNNFGVVSQELIAKSKTPYTTHLQNSNVSIKRNPDQHLWLDGIVKNLVGLGEISATGMHKETGVLVVEVPLDSALAGLGICKQDVILKINQEEIESVEQLSFVLNRLKNLTVTVTVWRCQNETTLTVSLPQEARKLEI